MSTYTPTINRRPPGGPGRLSYPQERLFLLDQIMPGLAAYNVPTLVRVPAHLDSELLRRAGQLVVARHEILRTRIRLVDGEPVQEVSPEGEVSLTVEDLRHTPEPGRAERAARLMGDLARRPFDLGHDTLLRLGLAHVGEQEDLLLIVFHHIGSDHASGGLLFAELDAAYSALQAGTEPELPELPIQYADFASWQREHLSGPGLEELIDYWKGQLTGAPDRLELPADRPRPSVQSYRGALREFTIDRASARSLRELARGQGVSTFMVMLAAFKALLCRYTGAEDLVVGAPVSGRHYDEIANLLGFFSNTLALRTDLSGDPTFAELLARVKATTLEAQIYQELPFEKLVEVLNPERAQSHSPVFQVLLGYDVAPSEPARLAGHELEQLPVPGWAWARFDLSIVIREVPDGTLRAQLEYATDLFDEGTIDRLVGHYQSLLADAARDPLRPISELEILSTSEYRQLVVQANDTARHYDLRCLHELFSAQAAHLPDAVAVSTAEERISYRELDQRANQLARELVALNVGTGSLVGICLERSVDLLVAMLGVLKSGAAYVPIDPSYPPQRQEFMLADSGAPVLLTQERFQGVLDARGATVVCVDLDRGRIADRDSGPLEIESDPEQLAYVIYTSGSTGQPKGVEVTHRSVANLVAHMRERPGLSEHDVVANLTTPAFDLSVPDWYLTLTTGARLEIIPREATFDGVELADWLARTGATFVQATPTTWQLLIDTGWKGSAGLKIVCGGEALPEALAGELQSRGASLWHMYGPTETTVWSSVLELEPAEGPVKLGGPISNTTFYVLDQRRHPVPIGVPGELYIGGDGLALGYRHRPELTAEKFVADPFTAGHARRLYRTGDLVRWREGGTLEYLGRIDQQVKLRGFRIELGEIESVLVTHPAVRAAVALVREDSPGDRRLVAYVVTPIAQDADVEELRRLLKTKLPPFMVPSAFVILDSFPVTANGKLDLRALPAPDGLRPELARSYSPPETPVEESLASIWREVLGIDRVGRDDDFFDLGGHSMLAVKMLARLRDTFGLELYLGHVFDHSTIRELAPLVADDLLADTSDEELESLLAEMELEEP